MQPWAPKTDEVPNLYFTTNIFRLIQLISEKGDLPCMGDVRNEYKILVRKPEVKRPLGRHRYRR
jgi:hypothetical protein